MTIEDEGPGIPEESIEKVFEKFYRRRALRPVGTGLGLSIVKGFIIAHNGPWKFVIFLMGAPGSS